MGKGVFKYPFFKKIKKEYNNKDVVEKLTFFKRS